MMKDGRTGYAMSRKPSTESWLEPADMMQFEREAQGQGFARIAGVDEAGRGPVAGPIAAAAVVLNGLAPGVKDSKQLTPAQRDELYAMLWEGGHAIGVALIDAAAIDRQGIQPANYAAMAQAVAALNPGADFLLVDGFMIRGCATPQKALIKGDRRSASIAAASIVAKVTRDRIMDEFDRAYPEYGFIRHKGYATAEHLDALRRLGPCPIHRRSFAPLAEPVVSGLLFDA